MQPSKIFDSRPVRRLVARASGWLLLGLLPGCAPLATKPAYRIGFSQCGTDGPWRQAMLAGMQRELSFHPEAQLRMLNANSNSDLQSQQIRQLVREGVDLLIVSPNMAAPVTPAVEEAYAQGIPVVLLDRRTTSPRYTAYVGANNVQVGRTAAHYAARLLHEQGYVVEVLGTAGSSATAGRQQGFAQGLRGYPKLRLVGQVAGNWQAASLQPALTALLQAHPEVSLIFAHNDGMARGAAQVC